MIRHEDVYRIGRIGKPHGVGGELSFMFDDDVFDRCDAEYLCSTSTAFWCRSSWKATASAAALRHS